jgi:hypothetical protein
MDPTKRQAAVRETMEQILMVKAQAEGSAPSLLKSRFQCQARSMALEQQWSRMTCLGNQLISY